MVSARSCWVPDPQQRPAGDWRRVGDGSGHRLVIQHLPGFARKIHFRISQAVFAK
jgi:hypothetical protein